MTIEDYNKFGRAKDGDDWYVLVEPRDAGETVLAVCIGEEPDEDGKYACDEIHLDPNDPTKVIAVEPRLFDEGYTFNPTTDEVSGWVS